MIIIDRFEGDFAICEQDGKMIDIPLKTISSKACEGDALKLEGGVYIVDLKETEKRKKRAQALLSKFKNR